MKKSKYIVIGILFLLFLTITILVVTNHIAFLDDSIYNSLISIRSNGWDTFFKTVTILGNIITVIIVTVLLFFLLKRTDYYVLLTSIITTVTMNQLLKHTIRRIRPDHIRLIKENGFSYPSGHAMISIALYGCLLYLIYKKIKNKYLKISLIVLLTFVIMGIGTSRIYVGVHYPSDILGGYTLALMILMLVIEYYNNHFRGNKNDQNGCK